MHQVRSSVLLLVVLVTVATLRVSGYEADFTTENGKPREPSQYVLPKLETKEDVMKFQERNATRIVCLLAGSEKDTVYAISSHHETQKHLRSLHPEDFNGLVEFAYVSIEDEEMGDLLHRRMQLVNVVPSMVCSKHDEDPQTVAIKNTRAKGIGPEQARRLRELIVILAIPPYNELKDDDMWNVVLTENRKAIAQLLVHKAGYDVEKSTFRIQAGLWRDSEDMVFYHVNADENPSLERWLGALGGQALPYIVSVYPMRLTREGECGQLFPSILDCTSTVRYDYELLADSERMDDGVVQALRLWDEWTAHKDLPKLNDTEILYPHKNSPKQLYVCIYSSELPQHSNSADVLKACRRSMGKLNDLRDMKPRNKLAVGYIVRLEEHPLLQKLVMKQKPSPSMPEHLRDEDDPPQDGNIRSPILANFNLDITTGKAEATRRYRYFAKYVMHKLSPEETAALETTIADPSFDYKERTMMMGIVTDDSHGGSLQMHTKTRFNISKEHIEDHLGGIRPSADTLAEEVATIHENVEADDSDEYSRDDREIPVLTEELWEECKQALAKPGPDGGPNQAVFIFVRGTCDLCDKLDVVFKDVAQEAEEISFPAYMVNCTITPALCGRFDVKGYPDILVARSWHFEGQISECCRKPRLFKDLAATFYHYHGILATRAVVSWLDIVTGPSVLPLDEFEEEDILDDDEERAYGADYDKKDVGFYGNEAIGYRLHDENKLRGLSMACYSGFAERFLGRMPFKEMGSTSLVNRIDIMRKDPDHQVTVYNADDINSEVYQHMMSRASANCVGDLPECCNKMEDIVNANRKALVTLITHHNIHMISEVLREPQWPTVTLYTMAPLKNTDKVHETLMPFYNELVVFYRRHAAKVQDKAAMIIMTTTSMPELAQPFLARVRQSHPDMYDIFLSRQILVSLTFGVNSSSYAIYDAFPKEDIPDKDPFPRLAWWVRDVIDNPAKYMHETKAPEFSH